MGTVMKDELVLAAGLAAGSALLSAAPGTGLCCHRHSEASPSSRPTSSVILSEAVVWGWLINGFEGNPSEHLIQHRGLPSEMGW